MATVPIAITVQKEVSECPNCGHAPVSRALVHEKVEYYGKHDYSVLQQITQEVYCPACNLKAPMEVWEAISDKMRKSGDSP